MDTPHGPLAPNVKERGSAMTVCVRRTAEWHPAVEAGWQLGCHTATPICWR